MPPLPQPLTSPAWCFSSCIPSVTLWLIRKTPLPILPLTCLHALFIGILKVTLGLLGLSALEVRWGWGALSISPLTGPKPLEFYACEPVGESECTLSQVDRAFIHSTFKVCRWSAAIAITLSASVCPPPSPLLPALSPVFQRGVLACATSSQGFGPLTGRLWGIRQVRKKKRWRRKRSKPEQCPQRVKSAAGVASFRIVQHWAKWSCIDEWHRLDLCNIEDGVTEKQTGESIAKD